MSNSVIYRVKLISALQQKAAPFIQLFFMPERPEAELTIIRFVGLF